MAYSGKDASRDRMILDARPANLCEESECRRIYSLGSLQQLQHIFLEEGQVLVMHCEDLREYYHAFEIGDQRRIRNSLKACFRPSEVQHLRCYKPELKDAGWVVPALNTMAMGDTNAVAFGQVAHLSVLLRTGEFELEDFFRPETETI